MELAPIINQYYDAYAAKNAGSILPGHRNAINAICSCRTPDAGELYVQCPACNHEEWRPLSCGHRSCPKCEKIHDNQWRSDLDKSGDQAIYYEYGL